MKDIPCVSHPEIKLCDSCNDEVIYQIHEILQGLGKLMKTLDTISHDTECASTQPCDCWKSKITEIYNG